MTLLCGAENIGYLPRDINLAKIIEEEDKITELEFKHINMTAMYILTRVTSSQCMGLAGSGFKNMKWVWLGAVSKTQSVPIDDGQTVSSLAPCRPSLG